METPSVVTNPALAECNAGHPLWSSFLAFHQVWVLTHLDCVRNGPFRWVETRGAADKVVRVVDWPHVIGLMMEGWFWILPSFSHYMR